MAWRSRPLSDHFDRAHFLAPAGKKERKDQERIAGAPQRTYFCYSSSKTAAKSSGTIISIWPVK